MSMRRHIVAVLGMVMVVTTASAQSLGDIAKKEEARRKDVKKASKVYTNDDLHSDASAPAPAAPAPSPQAGASGSGQVPPSASGEQPKAETPAPAEDPKKTEGYWKDRLTKARDDLQRAQTFAEALQSRINALTTDFANRADPAQRAQVERDRQKSLAELDRVKKEIEANTKAITDIQEEGRKAGVPAGWLR